MKWNLVIIVFSIMSFISCKTDQAQGGSQNSDPIIAELNSKINSNPDNSSLLYERGKYLYEKESYDEAINDLVKAIAIDSLKPEYYHMLSEVELDYYKSRAALNTMELAADRFPTRIPTLLKLCEIQYILTKHEESIATVNRVLAVDPQNADAYLMLGFNFRDMGDTIRAINSYQTAVEIEPEMTDAWIMLGQLHEQKEDPKALIYFDNAIRTNPKSIEAKHSKAYYLQNHDAVPEAIELYRSIIIDEPDYPDAYLNAGILYLEIDSLDNAYEHFNLLTRVKPESAMAYYYRGMTSQRKNDLEKARSDYNTAMILDSNLKRAKQALDALDQKID